MSIVEHHCIICMAPVNWEQQLAEARSEREDWKRMADAADTERAQTYRRWRLERDNLKKAAAAAGGLLAALKYIATYCDGALDTGTITRDDAGEILGAARIAIDEYEALGVVPSSP